MMVNPFDKSAEAQAAKLGAGQYLIQNGGVRGGYAGYGLHGKFAGKGSLAFMGGVRANWTMDQGFGASVDAGLGLQEGSSTRLLGLGTMPFVSENVGVGGSYDFYSEKCGWRSPRKATTPAIYGGAGNVVGGGHGAMNSVNSAAIGLNYGGFYFGLLVDPERVVQNFVDSYHVIRGTF
jgi:hypothetical protein